jgi:hypothetical protein
MPMQSPPDRSSAPERGTIDQTVTDKGHTGATSLAHPTVPVSPRVGLMLPGSDACRYFPLFPRAWSSSRHPARMKSVSASVTTMIL